VSKAARGVVGARARARIRLRGPLHRGADGGALRPVAARPGDNDAPRAVTPAEPVEGPLVRFVRGVTRDRERLEPAVGELAGGVAAEDRQEEPGGDHAPAAGQT